MQKKSFSDNYFGVYLIIMAIQMVNGRISENVFSNVFAINATRITSKGQDVSQHPIRNNLEVNSRISIIVKEIRVSLKVLVQFINGIKVALMSIETSSDCHVTRSTS
jgi:hypothetical protein